MAKSKKKIEEDFTRFRSALSPEEILFADHFVRDPNKSRAARAAGNPAVTAGGLSIAGQRFYNKPTVKEYINFVLSQSIGEPSENLKVLKSIAEGNLADYFTPTLRIKSDWMEVSLTVVIEKLQYEQSLEYAYFLEYADSKTERTASLQKLASLKKQIGMLKIELGMNPGAKRIIKGNEYLAPDVELDLVKIKEDVEHGKVKAYKMTENGPQVEMYDAKSAAVELLKISGSYEKDNARNLSFSLEDAELIFK